MRRCSARAGFTILEVLVAMGILLFGMVAVLALLTWGAGTTRSAQLRTSAAAAAEAVVADLEESLFPEVGGEAGEPLEIQARRPPGAAGVSYSARAVQNPERPVEYRVDVEMTWDSQGVRKDLSFTTLLLREVPFGERLRRAHVRATAPAEQAPLESSPGSDR